ncbi:MAG: bile acid:sodium symporter [Planctomycetota bacterium]
MISAAGRQWFLIALALVLFGGAVWHTELVPFAERIPRDPLVAAILLAMSAPIDLRRSLSGPRAGVAAAIGIGVNSLLAGPLAWVASRLLNEQLAIGLIVAALAPCTMASAAVWTRRGGGNDAVALTVTVVTNVLTFVLLPAWAWLLVGSQQSVDAVALGLRLFLIVVVPIAAGQAIRSVRPLRYWCDSHRKGLSLFAQLGLLGMVLSGAVRSGALLEDPATRLGVSDWGLLLVLAALVHVALFVIAWWLARSAGANWPEALAAAVAGSQKTLAVGLSVAMSFGPLAILPMIVYHGLQLLIDTVLVERLGNRGGDAAGG